MIRKLVLPSLLIGLVLAVMTMILPYRYCRNGPARGYPFAAWCPVCEATRFSVGAGHVGYFHVVDLPRLLGNVLLWSGLSVGVLSYRARRIAG